MEKPKTIRFAPDMLEAIRSGRKTLTSRPRRYKGVYEVIRGSFAKPVRLGIYVELTPLGRLSAQEIADKYYREEGFSSPEGYLSKLRELYKGKIQREMWLHKVGVMLRPDYGYR